MMRVEAALNASAIVGHSHVGHFVMSHVVPHYPVRIANRFHQI